MYHNEVIGFFYTTYTLPTTNNSNIKKLQGGKMQTVMKKILPLALMLGLLSWGCARDQMTSDTMTKPAAEMQQEQQIYKGKIVGKSRKAKTISIEVGKGDKAKTMMVKFDDRTTGLEFAEVGEAAIITWEMRGTDKYATVVKPKLAKLPEGVAEIKVKEMKDLIDSNKDFMLIDSRPSKRYAQSHLPGAVSIPVSEMKSKAAEFLPEDKNKLLIFYCGGPT